MEEQKSQQLEEFLAEIKTVSGDQRLALVAHSLGKQLMGLEDEDVATDYGLAFYAAMASMAVATACLVIAKERGVDLTALLQKEPPSFESAQQLNELMHMFHQPKKSDQAN